MLSNLSADGQASVQTILLGQPEFRRMLASRELDQLRQRVIASCHLTPLDPPEVQAYVEHRLTTAGWSGHPAILPSVYEIVHRATGGVPRRINRLFSRVLLLGALEAAGTITPAMVEQTQAELAADLDGPAPASPHEAGDLAARVSALEHKLARRDQVMTQLADLLGGMSQS